MKKQEIKFTEWTPSVSKFFEDSVGGGQDGVLTIDMEGAAIVDNQNGFQVIQSIKITIPKKGPLEMLFETEESAKPLISTNKNFMVITELTILMDFEKKWFQGPPEGIQKLKELIEEFTE